jgi:hypothetical protein
MQRFFACTLVDDKQALFFIRVFFLHFDFASAKILAEEVSQEKSFGNTALFFS